MHQHKQPLIVCGQRACKFSRLMAETYSSASLSHQLSLAFSITLEPQLQGPAPQSCSGWHCLYYQKTVPNFYPTAPSTLVTSHSALSLPAPWGPEVPREHAGMGIGLWSSECWELMSRTQEGHRQPPLKEMGQHSVFLSPAVSTEGELLIYRSACRQARSSWYLGTLMVITKENSWRALLLLAGALKEWFFPLGV